MACYLKFEGKYDEELASGGTWITYDMLRGNDAGQVIEDLERYHRPNFGKLHVLS